ncbi:MAG: nitrilase-related carbon-nitrogen hydrolase [Thermodesulfobacteriota bacterium]
MEAVRIAAVIAYAPVEKEPDNLARMRRWVDRAASKGARIVCFPELNISGYGTKACRLNAARKLNDPVTETVKAMSRRSGTTILAGLMEKDEQGGAYASHLVIQPDGCLGVYRKLHIAPPERSVFQAGQDIPLFRSGGLTFGIQLCYDAHFPELSTFMAESGADVIFIPHASPRGTPAEKYRSWLRHLRARAFDNSLFIVACNQIGDNGDGLFFPGLAVAISPSGDILKKRFSATREAMMIVDLSMDELRNIRGHRMRYFLPNRRPELFERGRDPMKEIKEQKD